MRAEIVLAYVLAAEIYKKYSQAAKIIGIGNNGKLLRLNEPGRVTAESIMLDLGVALATVGKFSITTGGTALNITYTGQPNVEVDNPSDSSPS